MTVQSSLLRGEGQRFVHERVEEGKAKTRQNRVALQIVTNRIQGGRGGKRSIQGNQVIQIFQW